MDPMTEQLELFEVNDEQNVPLAVDRLIKRTQEDLKVFGLDCEWDLVSKKGAIHKPDILQIGTIHGFCVIFKLHLLKNIPPDLKGFLEDPFFAKVGVGVKEDCDKLKQCYSVLTEGAIDLRHIADDLEFPPKGLSHLTGTVLGVNLTKYNYNFHHWTGRLSALQKQYAALDAIYSARVFYKLSHDRLTNVYGDEWRNWAHEEYHERTMALWDKYVNKNFEFSKSKFYSKEIVNSMIKFSDLTPILREDELLEEQSDSRQRPERFRAKFGKGKIVKEDEKPKRVPMRYLRRYIRKLESQGIDPTTIPTDNLPVCALDEDGKLDMSKI